MFILINGLDLMRSLHRHKESPFLEWNFLSLPLLLHSNMSPSGAPGEQWAFSIRTSMMRTLKFCCRRGKLVKMASLSSAEIFWLPLYSLNFGLQVLEVQLQGYDTNQLSLHFSFLLLHSPIAFSSSEWANEILCYVALGKAD